jgi:NAD(P)H-flavin reductase
LSILQYPFYSGFQSLRVKQKVERGTVNLDVHVPRITSIKAGQYVRIWMPRVSPFFSHSLMIVWWSHGEHHTQLELLARRGASFSQRLQKLLSNKTSLVPFSMMSRPYGKTLDLRPFSAVLFVASGTGFLAQIPYILQSLIEDRVGAGARKMIHVVWKCKTEQAYWVKDWCQRLVNIDNNSRVSAMEPKDIIVANRDL